jgi:sugar phosphate isomerase/epimerase
VTSTSETSERPLGLLAVQLYSVRDALTSDPSTVLSRIADMGYVGVEVVCSAGLPPEIEPRVAEITVGPARLKPMLDAYGLVACAAHTALPERHNANAVLDEQELLGNDRLIISDLGALPGGRREDLDELDTLKRAAERFNEAAALVAERGMRLGYHNHHWEWVPSIDGRPAYDVFWDHVDPSIVAEVDIYWAQVAGRKPAQEIAQLGSRAELVHVKDGPLVVGEPMTAVGSGKADIVPALQAGDHVRWHIVELDECAGDVFEALAASAEWLVRQGLSGAGRRFE